MRGIFTLPERESLQCILDFTQKYLAVCVKNIIQCHIITSSMGVLGLREAGTGHGTYTCSGAGLVSMNRNRLAAGTAFDRVPVMCSWGGS
jgi:hypothetical protein